MKLSIIIPTYNEAENVRTITDRIRQAMRETPCDCAYEILFVDDSRDNTPQVLAGLAAAIPEVRYIHRTGERGLASAVVSGFANTRGDYIIVMDADLQHPPGLLPLIAARLAEADVVIPSRFIAGGSDGGLSPLRKLVSWTARVIGRLALKRLRNISDCTGGYFGLRREVLTDAQLDPVGWKILIEVLAKGRYSSVHEIPYKFDYRSAGKSKMSLAEQWNYLRHLARLILSSPEDYRFYSFCLVGAAGVIVNLVSLHLLLTTAHLSETVASVGASLIAMFHNFLWNDNVTWRGLSHGPWWKRLDKFPQYALICGIGVAITALSMQIFIMLGWNLYLGQLTGIALALHWSFTANNWWTWSAQNPRATSVTRECARPSAEKTDY